MGGNAYSMIFFRWDNVTRKNRPMADSLKMDIVVELVGGGSVIDGAYLF